MARYLVVTHMSSGSPELVEHLRRLQADDPDLSVHLVIPERHPLGRSWSHPQVHIRARAVVARVTQTLAAIGIDATGEVGDANPIIAVRAVFRRDGAGSFQGIVLATPPIDYSRWWRGDIPGRLRAAYPGHEMTHIVSDPGAAPGSA